MFSPLLASASLLSFLTSQTADQSQASATALNSQTVPLLVAANNINPAPQGSGDLALVAGQALLPQEGPDGTASDIASQPSSSAISVYTVHDGDTLSGIAAMFGVSVGTITGANNLAGKPIQPGEQLIILPITGVQYAVQKGDTLASIAKKYSADADDIAQYNNLADDATLTVGDSILIPDGETSAPVAAAKPKTSTTKSSSSSSSGVPSLSQIAAGATEPYLGGSGPAIPGYFNWPLNGGVITQGLHGWNAVDIGAPTGTSIYAAAAGTVIIANDDGAWNGGYGNYVVISHPNGTQTLYAHMSKVLATQGESVSQGDIIGRVGMTGEATGPHLHFEVRGAANPFASLPLGYTE